MGGDGIRVAMREEERGSRGTAAHDYEELGCLTGDFFPLIPRRPRNAYILINEL